MTEKYLKYKDSNIFYRIFGKGLPLILIHGFGEDGTIWKNQIEKFSEKFLLIVPDIPGSGKSTLLKDGDIDEYSVVIKAIIDNEAINGPVVLLGHSMGGYISLAFAEKFPEQVKALGLLHSTAYADTAEKIEARLKSINFIKENGSAAFLKTSIPGLFTTTFNEVQSNIAKELIEHNSSISKEALVQYYEAMIKRPDRTVLLEEATFPVLFIIGKHDQAVPFASSMKQCYLPTISDVYIMEKSAHMGMLEESTLFNEALFKFTANL